MMILNWLKWRIATRELSELERWKIEWETLRRWLAEFPDVAIALDHLQAGALGSGGRPSIFSLREMMRAQMHTRICGYEPWQDKSTADQVHIALIKNLRGQLTEYVARVENLEQRLYACKTGSHAASSSPEILGSSVTVDTPEFRGLLATLVDASDSGPDKYGAARAPFIAHIDAHTSTAVARAVAEKDADLNWHKESLRRHTEKLKALGDEVEQLRATQEALVAASADMVKYTRLARGIQNPAGYHLNGPWEDFYACDDVVRALAARTQQPAAVPAEQFKGNDGLGIASCGKPLCSEGHHHPLCSQAAPAHPPAGELPVLPDLVSTLNEYLQREMPAGTVIGDPAWWAPSIAKAIATRQPAPVTLSVAIAVNDQGSTVIVSLHRDGIQTVIYCQTHQPGYEGVEVIKLDAIVGTRTKGGA